jgi:hypothetical protein
VNWEAVAAIAEVIASVAVVATLVYLSIQLGQNTEATRSAGAKTMSTAVTDVLRQISSDTQLYGIYSRGLADNSTNLEERARFDILMMQIYRGFENLLLDYRRGHLEEEIWEGFYAQIQWLVDQPGGRKSWDRQKRFLAKSVQGTFGSAS